MEHFDIPDKNAEIGSLEPRRKLPLTFNRSRRFRYVADVERREHSDQLDAQARLRRGLAVHQFLARLEPDADRRRFYTDLFHALVENAQIDPSNAEINVHVLAERFNVVLTEGLNSRQIKKHREKYGSNTFPTMTFLVFLREACEDLVLRVLVVFAVVSIGLGIATGGLDEDSSDGIGLLMVIFLDVSVTTLTDYQAHLHFREVDEMGKEILNNISVKRDGVTQKVSRSDLVVGDIVRLDAGDEIPADGLLIEGQGLTVDESSMTMESNPQRKLPNKSILLLSGTKVQAGFGQMLVTGVGMQTQWGKLMATLGKDKTETPLQVKLSGLQELICKVGSGFALLTLLVLLGRFLYEKSTADNILEWGREDARAILGYFTIAVAIMKVAASEDLPLGVSLRFARATKSIFRGKALVRNWAACEAIGSATAICSDTTGTLTTNEMEVVKVCVAECIGDVKDGKFETCPAVIDVLTQIIFTNTSATVEVGSDREQIFIGSRIETALLRFGMALKGDLQPTNDEFEILTVDPFNSEQKRMGVIGRHHGDKLFANWKGDTAILFEMCDRTIDKEGNVVSFPPEQKGAVNKLIASMSNQSELKTLCLAYKELRDDSYNEVPHEVPKENFVFAAILAFRDCRDDIRPGVPNAVEGLTFAGIKVRIVTGDDIQVSIAVAKECGIYTGGRAVLGEHFREWTDYEMASRISNLEIIARCSPTDKHRLVKYLKKSGEVVVVTGDGTNDAPALREADIGIAMGLHGTTVAKQAADVILLDDDFKTIFRLFKWGRYMYSNIRKYFQFHLTMTVVAFLFTVTGEATLTAMQLLWIDLITDQLGAEAVTCEPPHDGLLKKEDNKRGFITYVMWRNIVGQAVYQLVVLGLLQYKGRDILHLEGPELEVEAQLNSIIFNSFVFCQIFNQFNSREMEHLNVFARIFDDRSFLLTITLTTLQHMIIVNFLGKFFSTVPLSLNQWLITVGIGAFSMFIAVVVKCIPVPSGKPVEPALVSNHGEYAALPGGPLFESEGV